MIYCCLLERGFLGFLPMNINRLSDVHVKLNVVPNPVCNSELKNNMTLEQPVKSLVKESCVSSKSSRVRMMSI